MTRRSDTCADFRRASAVTRRRFVQAGGLGLVGLTLPELMRAKAAASGSDGASAAPSGLGRAKAVILLFCWGGPSQLETWDPKPDAPAENRGPFKPISTLAPGVRIGEHLPLMAKQMHRCAVVRSAHHSQAAHAWGKYYMLTGHAPPVPFAVSSTNWPTLGSMVGCLRPGNAAMPNNVTMPYTMFDGTFHPGQYSGFLGAEFQPFVYQPKGGVPYKGKSPETGIAEMEMPSGMTGRRLRARADLVSQLTASSAHLSEQPSGRALRKYTEKAVDLLGNPTVRRAFDVDAEPDKLKAEYGNHIAGRSMLTARRLVESGVPLVSVICAAGDLNGSAGDNWDTHGNIEHRMKHDLLPPLDRGASALLRDLADRGMLDETLVIITGEFGRTPKFTGNGRDHWPGVFSFVMAGGGIRGGTVYGASDRIAAYPAMSPVTPADFVATVFGAMGIPPQSELHDYLGRPIPACDGSPVRDLFG